MSARRAIVLALAVSIGLAPFARAEAAEARRGRTSRGESSQLIEAGSDVSDRAGSGALKICVDRDADPAVVKSRLRSDLQLSQGGEVRAVRVEKDFAYVDYGGAKAHEAVVGTMPSDSAAVCRLCACGYSNRGVAGSGISNARGAGWIDVCVEPETDEEEFAEQLRRNVVLTDKARVHDVTVRNQVARIVFDSAPAREEIEASLPEEISLLERAGAGGKGVFEVCVDPDADQEKFADRLRREVGLSGKAQVESVAVEDGWAEIAFAGATPQEEVKARMPTELALSCGVCDCVVAACACAAYAATPPAAAVAGATGAGAASLGVLGASGGILGGLLGADVIPGDGAVEGPPLSPAN